jgi:hypothetical protein
MNKPRISIWGTRVRDGDILWGLFQCQFVCEWAAFVECAETYIPVVLPVLCLTDICMGTAMVSSDFVSVKAGFVSMIYCQWFLSLRWLWADIMCQLWHTCFVMWSINEHII